MMSAIGALLAATVSAALNDESHTEQVCISHIEHIMKCLEDFLQLKRMSFPRFYFLSNDEMLEILSQARSPRLVENHLLKCFSNIHHLEYMTEIPSLGDIISVVSLEGEWLPLVKRVKPRGNVEVWLSLLDDSVSATLRLRLKQALSDFSSMKRTDWLLKHPCQTAIVASQIMWSNSVLECMRAPRLRRKKDLQNLCTLWTSNLKDLAQAARNCAYSTLEHSKITAMITTDVHCRDVLDVLVDGRVVRSDDFEWTKNLRYEWNGELDSCTVHQGFASVPYSYEYLGCLPRLVVTPLTDRCYLTLMLALHLHLGGAPMGPAGTGKTESVKELARSLGKLCVVFNCSAAVESKMMGRLCSGLAQTGAWACFDEFNRIDVEVLSIVAQQLRTLKVAKDARVLRFLFEGREVTLIPSCGCFVTMNPGYEGRVELPDNLKSLLRPVSMTQPDTVLIAEVMLYSEGVEGAGPLARRFAAVYRLAAEQLTNQQHYDFGLRALRAALLLAGKLKRLSPEDDDNTISLRAVCALVLPTLVVSDILPFTALLADVFGVAAKKIIKDQRTVFLREAVVATVKRLGLQLWESQVEKVVQLFGAMEARHGLMLIGQTCVGKSTITAILAHTLTHICGEHGHKGLFGGLLPVAVTRLNPKAVTLQELFGTFDLHTLEWTDGLLPNIMRTRVATAAKTAHWIVCDGPVDASWIENLNTLLDDSRMTCLANGERIPFPSSMSMLFEVEDVEAASPATISRCGMVHMDSGCLTWQVLMGAWVDKALTSLPSMSAGALTEIRAHLLQLFDVFLPAGLAFLKDNASRQYYPIPIPPMAAVTSLCNLLSALLAPDAGYTSRNEAGSVLRLLLSRLLFFAFIWSFGGGIVETGARADFDGFVRELVARCSAHGLSIPATHNVYSFFVEPGSHSFQHWETCVRKLPLIGLSSHFVVPTPHTACYHYLVSALMRMGVPTILAGSTGVGKSVIIEELISTLVGNGEPTAKWSAAGIQLTAYTTDGRMQQFLETRLTQRRLEPESIRERMLAIVDDISIPANDQHGCQPPLEVLRQFLDAGGVYDCRKFVWQPITGLAICATSNPSSAGHSKIPSRLLRHFVVLTLPEPEPAQQQYIFESILTAYHSRGHAPEQATLDLVRASAAAAVELCVRMREDFPPAPGKIHYTFNLRDVARLIAGLQQAPQAVFANRASLLRLFLHESMRVFHDRLVSEEDRLPFRRALCDVVRTHFREVYSPVLLKEQPPFFADFYSHEPTARIYADIGSLNGLPLILRQYFEEMNIQHQRTDVIVVFEQAAEHVLRISRILRQPEGHALLIGANGMGKRTLARLSCFVVGFECISLDGALTASIEQFRQQLRTVILKTGVRSKRLALLVNCASACRAAVEDLTCLVSSADIHGLFDRDGMEAMLGELRACNVPGTHGLKRTQLLKTLMDRVKDNLRLILHVSVAEGHLSALVRGHPSLVNRCTIDWFDNWPRDALLEVARSRLERAPFVLSADEKTQVCLKIAKASVGVHEVAAAASMSYLPAERQHYYTTPLVYFELLDILSIIYEKKRKEINVSKERLQNGLSMLAATRDSVASMQAELAELEPELQRRAESSAELLKKLQQEEAQMSMDQQSISAEEAALQEETRNIEALAAQAQSELDATIPALDAAFAALDALDKNDIAEIRVYAKPPTMVMRVMSAVCVLLGRKDDWPTAKQMLADTTFLRQLLAYKKNAVSLHLLQQLEPYVSDPRFNPEDVGKISAACKSMCMWVLAIDHYARVSNMIAPKRAKVNALQADMEAAMGTLRQKQLELARVQLQLDGIRLQHRSSVEAHDDLNHHIETARLRMSRAGVLMSMLRAEEQRWLSEVAALDQQLAQLVGSSFLSACCVVYFGVFPTEARRWLLERWIQVCESHSFQVDRGYSLFDHLANRVLLDRWRLAGLPEDLFSTENAVIATTARKCPLMIDPQGQANAWIRKLENMTWLCVTFPSDPNLLRTLQTAVRTGRPVLLEDAGATLDPVLDPLLLRQVRMVDNQPFIRVGDVDVEYDRNFRLYITTRLNHPQYTPDVCGKVTLINFSVSVAGLEEQLLCDVVQLERPRLERKRLALAGSITADRTDLRETEDKILHLLSDSACSLLLDNQELIDTLQEAKHTARAIKKRMRLAQETEVAINAARHQYMPIAKRGAVLCFAMADCARIDSSAQTSLAACKQLFLTVVESMADKDERIADELRLTAHLLVVRSAITKAVFQRVARGLPAANKALFAFLIASAIMRHRSADRIDAIKPNTTSMSASFKGEAPEAAAASAAETVAEDPDDLANFIAPPNANDSPEDTDEEDSPAKSRRRMPLLEPDEVLTLEDHLSSMSGLPLPLDLRFGDTRITEAEWALFIADQDAAAAAVEREVGATSCWMVQAEVLARSLESQLLVFLGLAVDIKTNPERWSKFLCIDHPLDHCAELLGERWITLTLFQRLILIKTLVPEKLTVSMKDFIRAALGNEYIENLPLDIGGVYADSAASTPVLFLLAPGGDPSESLQRFARVRGMGARLTMLSLGRGFGQTAADAVRRAMRAGDWVFLQNCHLAASWMPALEQIVLALQAAVNARDPTLNLSFRLWLSATPGSCVPVNVMQSALKICVEPPQGVRSTLLSTFMSIVGPTGYASTTGLSMATNRNSTQTQTGSSTTMRRKSRVDLRGRRSTNATISRTFTQTDLSISVATMSSESGAEGARSTAEGATASESFEAVEIPAERTDSWKVLLLGLCYFNAVVNERRAFGSLGWNASSADLEVASTVLRQILTEHPSGALPWRELRTFCCDVVYGGRVADEWDRRTLEEMFARFCSTEVFTEGHLFCPGLPAYSTPPAGSTIAEYQDYIENLPMYDDPALSGLHHFADGDNSMRHSRAFLAQLRSVAPLAVNHLPESDAAAVAALITKYLKIADLRFEDNPGRSRLPRVFRSQSKEGTVISAIGIFVRQEIALYNNLLAVVQDNLKCLLSVLRGDGAATADMEELLQSVRTGQLPHAWQRVAYPSQLPLGAWLEDLQRRVAAVRELTVQSMSTYPLGAFFSPRAFLTAVVQDHCRAAGTSVDQIVLDIRLPIAGVPPPSGSVLVAGLHVLGASWRDGLAELRPREAAALLPPLCAAPCVERPPADGMFVCPLFRTARRADDGSAGFVAELVLPVREESAPFWVARGVAAQLERE